MQVHYARVDHDDYQPIDPDISILQLCRCGCGAVRDTRDVPDPQPFGDWAMTHQPPTHGSYVCAVCLTLALPTNSFLVDGHHFVHRGCLLEATL